MTPKEKLRSLEKKMQRLEIPNFDIKEAARHFGSIQLYWNLQREHFFLKFEIEHCKTCGKKL